MRPREPFGSISKWMQILGPQLQRRGAEPLLVSDSEGFRHAFFYDSHRARLTHYSIGFHKMISMVAEKEVEMRNSGVPSGKHVGKCLRTGTAKRGLKA